MHTLAKLSGYGAALALLTLGAYATGSTVGPLTDPAPAATRQAAGGHGDVHGGAVPETAPSTDPPPGIAATRNGFTATPLASPSAAGVPRSLAFRITDSAGAVVTAFDEEHTQRLHLIVVRADTTGYQHLHPTMDPDGTWRTLLATPAGGPYRAFADFTPSGGPATTLGMDLTVEGDYTPVTHAPSRTALVAGYEVRLDGELTAGAASPVTLTVSREGRPVTDLEPYLGAYGHLVALRDTDLAYLHVHPEGTPGDGSTTAGPQVGFVAEVPSTGGYRLFLDFRHGGTVHTAEFTVSATDGAPGAAPTDHTHDTAGGGH